MKKYVEHSRPLPLFSKHEVNINMKLYGGVIKENRNYTI